MVPETPPILQHRLMLQRNLKAVAWAVVGLWVEELNHQGYCQMLHLQDTRKKCLY